MLCWKILKKFKIIIILDNTPLDPHHKFVPNDGETIAQVECAKIIGSSMYLIMNCTRFDIGFAVGKLSKFTHNPNDEHWIDI